LPHRPDSARALGLRARLVVLPLYRRPSGERSMKRVLLLVTALVLMLLGVAQTRAGMVTFNSTGSIQTFTAPGAGTYDITVAGAQGGNDPTAGTTGGDGVFLSGQIKLTAGEVLQIVVGGQGGSGNPTFGSGGGGGGGSFVYISGTPAHLLI